MEQEVKPMGEQQRVVVLSGAGISAESGIKTFRGSDGLWEGHNVMEVASPEGFARNPELVLHFYNLRRAQLREVEPNEGHRALARLESHYQVQVITQNVDDLHERGGSSEVLHLHGELRKARSIEDSELIVDWLDDLNLGDLGPDGAQLRPHIVWFGESVPLIQEAAHLVAGADRLIVVGTSLQVYPAAGLIELAPRGCPVTLIDPSTPELPFGLDVELINEPATIGLPRLVDQLLAEAH
ncbi:MAG: NAD-dependent deacylase [Myxococcota bacterium]|nr:NAD-dependent deacylase [Myxococcota bacterium]